MCIRDSRRGARHPRPLVARIAPPPVYSGAEGKLEAWLSAMRQQFNFYSLDDAGKVRLAAAVLAGPALTWYEGELSEGQPPAQWAVLEAALRARFQPVDTAERATSEMMLLTQGRGSVHTYVDRFRSLAILAPRMDEGTRTQLFIRGLNADVAKMIRMHGVTTLSGAITAAVRIGGAEASVAASHAQPSRLSLLGIEGLEQETSADAPSAAEGAPQSVAQQVRAALQEHLAAMQQQRRGRGAGASSGGGRGGKSQHRAPARFPHLSDEQRRAYMAAGQCFGCGSTAHRADACPRRKEDKEGNVTWPQGN